MTPPGSNLVATADPTGSAEARALRASIAVVWLTTGCFVVFPQYRAIGGAYLAEMGLPDALMFFTCAAEVLLGLRLLLRPTGGLLTALQLILVVAFTIILAAVEPRLLVHPLGMLSKNLPLLVVIGVVFEMERHGPTPRALAALRFGMAVVWLTEGIFPKLLFQHPWELGLVARLHLPGDPSLLVGGLGVVQALSGIAALTLRGSALRLVLGAQLLALVVLPCMVSVMDPVFLIHPFGPLTKNAPILVGTYILFRRCST